jgi:hypothetical protein
MLNKTLIPILLVIACTRTAAAPSAGFFLPDSIFEFSMRYKTVNDLIILPVTINDSVKVNLILDTGCRNMLLFGKRFEKIFKTQARPVAFSGLGSGKPVSGKLSLNNEVSIEAVLGRRIPIIIVGEKNLFSALPHVDGIIGYEIFAKFEIELNFPRKEITFRSSRKSTRSSRFSYVSMKVLDSKPVIGATVVTEKGEMFVENLLIDTGSSLGLIYSTGQNERSSRNDTLGRGLNGLLNGDRKVTKSLRLEDVEFRNVSTSVVASENCYASIGMEILKDHIVIMNYAESFVAFSKSGTT